MQQESSLKGARRCMRKLVELGVSVRDILEALSSIIVAHLRLNQNLVRIGIIQQISEESNLTSLLSLLLFSLRSLSTLRIYSSCRKGARRSLLRAALQVVGVAKIPTVSSVGQLLCVSRATGRSNIKIFIFFTICLIVGSILLHTVSFGAGWLMLAALAIYLGRSAMTSSSREGGDCLYTLRSNCCLSNVWSSSLDANRRRPLQKHADWDVQGLKREESSLLAAGASLCLSEIFLSSAWISLLTWSTWIVLPSIWLMQVKKSFDLPLRTRTRRVIICPAGFDVVLGVRKACMVTLDVRIFASSLSE